MGGLLFHVSRMYTEAEFRNLATTIPEDFNQKTIEFWNYVNERLNKLSGKIDKLYRDGICKDSGEALSQLQMMDNENYLAVKRLVEKGACFIATEDPVLLGESESWAVMLKNQQWDIVIQELFQENLEERMKYISNRIENTLKDNEIGILFLMPNLRVRLSEEIKIIRMWRFDPSDYLKSWQVKLRLKSETENDKDITK
ncbi:MAG: hypothetical protein JSV51_09085 [Candidatus Bathyarchaeota archaeon]|nr:MAG: hypothetical protein JSV51_09085 [Candidatus Bathyarchaeota archaeon]